MNVLPRLSVFSTASAALKCGLAALAVASFATVAGAKTHLKISANGAAIDAFENWTSGTPWAAIADFHNGNASRPVVDLVLELQALKAGGLDFDFEFVRTITNEQAKEAVINGSVQLTAETIWDDDIAAHADALAKTDPVIRNGEFIKGVYVLPTNSALLKAASLDELRSATAAVVASWALDVKTVEAMKPAAVDRKPTPELVYLAIQKGEAGFTLDEFSSNADLSIKKAGVKLVPIPHVTVAISGARSWIVSKAAPGSDAILAALTAGTKALRDNGTIERAYRESGFFNPAVADWKRLF